MDLGLSPSEQDVLTRVGAVAAEHGGADQLRARASAGAFDPDLDAALAATVTIGAPLPERLLVVTESARLGLPALPGPRLLVGADLVGGPTARPVAVVDQERSGPVRIPPTGGLLLVLSGADASMGEIGPGSITPVESSFGYPFGAVEAVDTTPLPAGRAGRLRALWHLTLAAEIAGSARAALEHLTAHLRGREQFGRPLATFQALRHRVAELAVSTEAATWLAREAAWHGDADRAGLAAVYARELAARMTPELVQLSGARGFTLEFPVHLFAMRLEGLRLIAGSGDRLAREVMPSPGRASVARTEDRGDG